MKRIVFLFSCLALAQPAFAAWAQDARDPGGVQAAHIHLLWLVMLAVTTIVSAAVLIAFLIPLWRAPRGNEETPPDPEAPFREERGASRSVIVAAVISAIGLFGLLVASVATDRALAHLPLDNGISLEMTGHQWWWEVRYTDADSSKEFSTANELHIPVGRPVTITLKADDVIHSFWVPNLHGKKDMIPGRDSIIQLRADRPGTYRGQCAEFCGYQHAYMALVVTAEPAADFDKWKQAQVASAAAPTDALRTQGQQVFLTSTCMMCHAIQGTTANARKAPDLTHVASRPTLASGALPNTPDNLKNWIADPQKIKPGVNMPATALAEEDLRALVAYLSGLK